MMKQIISYIYQLFVPVELAPAGNTLLAYHEELDRTYRQRTDSILTICPLCRYDEMYAIDKHNFRFEKRTERKESITEI